MLLPGNGLAHSWGAAVHGRLVPTLTGSCNGDVERLGRASDVCADETRVRLDTVTNLPRDYTYFFLAYLRHTEGPQGIPLVARRRP
jgi:hypothetical protein